jgi:hypothetical protein
MTSKRPNDWIVRIGTLLAAGVLGSTACSSGSSSPGGGDGNTYCQSEDGALCQGFGPALRDSGACIGSPVSSCPSNPVGCCVANYTSALAGDIDYSCFYGSNTSSSEFPMICTANGTTFAATPPF